MPIFLSASRGEPRPEGEMPKVTAVDNDSILLWVDPEAKMIGHEFRKFVYGNALRDALDTGLEIMEKYAATKWLSDERNGGALPPADIAWSKTGWKPRMLKAGWTYWALVPSCKVVGQMSIKQLVDDYARMGLTVRLFNEPEEGGKWLLGV
jgi:hypothetical protein